MEFVLTPSVVPNSADWSPLDFSGVSQSVLSGALRTVSRGQRWQAHYSFQNLIGDDRNSLAALMLAVRGKSNRTWISDPTYQQAGSFPAPELLGNNYFDGGTSSWAPTGTGLLSIYNRTLTLTAGSATSTGASQSVTLQAGYAYALRALLIDGPLTSGVDIGVRLADAATNYLVNGRGMVTSSAIATVTGPANQLPIYMQAGNGLAGGMQAFCAYASLRRCALAKNPAAAAYFSTLPIDCLPAGVNGLLRAGDRFEVNGEMKMCTQDLNSDGAGNGWLMFEPALRRIVPDNCPIIIGEPMMRGVLTNDAMQVTRPGNGTSLMSDFDFTFVEDSYPPAQLPQVPT